VANRRADAVGAGVAAADDDDVLAGGEDSTLVRDVPARDAGVLLRQEVHRVMDAVQLASGHREIARLLGAARQHDAIVLVEQLA
jgi:hypothetical protein